nr:efflux RND transporter periplasmic adaptor subunit [Pseudomonas viridiflava]
MCSVFLCRRHVMAAFLSISVLTGCGKPPGGPPPAPGTPEVGILAVQAQRVVFSTELPGRTAPFMIAEIRPQVSGIVQKRSFTEGSTVKAGQVLYLIDPATYRATYNSDLAALAKAEASLTSVRLKNERYKELAALDAVSRQDYDDAVSSLGESRADVASAKANVESSRINLAYTQVNAPITGRIGKSGITPGALVTANQTSTMATIQQLDPIYVDVTQPSAALLRLKKSLSNGEIQKSGATAAKVRLKLEDGSLYPLEGTLEFSDVTVDQDTGAITLRAVFPNPNADLLPGMYVRAVLEEGFKEQGLLVPQQAVSRDSTGKPMA